MREADRERFFDEEDVKRLEEFIGPGWREMNALEIADALEEGLAAAKFFEEFIGPGWLEMNALEIADALKEGLAAAKAEHDQVRAEYAETKRFKEAIIEAMHARGATFGHDVYDDVARELYGGHTALTRRIIAEVEEFARTGRYSS